MIVATPRKFRFAYQHRRYHRNTRFITNDIFWVGTYRGLDRAQKEYIADALVDISLISHRRHDKDGMEHRRESMLLAGFLTWEQRQEAKHELIQGQVVAFSGGALDHDRIAGNVYVAFDSRLQPPSSVYSSNAISETLKRKGNNGFRADAVVTCSNDDFGKALSVKHPRIIVEVRSPSNVGQEWEEKLFEYWSTPSIEQLVIVESENRSVASYNRDEHGPWQSVTTTIGNGSVAFPSVDLEMTLDEMYRNTSLHNYIESR